MKPGLYCIHCCGEEPILALSLQELDIIVQSVLAHRNGGISPPSHLPLPFPLLGLTSSDVVSVVVLRTVCHGIEVHNCRPILLINDGQVLREFLLELLRRALNVASHGP